MYLAAFNDSGPMNSKYFFIYNHFAIMSNDTFHTIGRIIMPIYSNKDYIRIMRPLPSFVDRDIFGIPVIEAACIDISALNTN